MVVPKTAPKTSSGCRGLWALQRPGKEYRRSAASTTRLWREQRRAAVWQAHQTRRMQRATMWRAVEKNSAHPR
jgi:hypothetical protein